MRRLLTATVLACAIPLGAFAQSAVNPTLDGLSIKQNGYSNFGATKGTNGYGFRDNGGAIQFKGSGGAWENVIGSYSDLGALPSPTLSTLGGVKAAAPVSHQWLKSIGTDGGPTLAQPDVSDVTNALSTTGDASGTSSTPLTPSSQTVISRSLKQIFNGCDAAGTNCSIFPAKNYGFSPSASGAVNRAALVAAIADACTAVKAIVQIDGGSYNLSTSAGEIVINCSGVSLVGAGMGATTILPSGTGNVFHFVPSSGPNILRNGMSGMLIYRQDNPTSGASLVLEKTNTFVLYNVEIDGGFTNLDCVSCAGTLAPNLRLGGNNSTTGSALARIRRGDNLTGSVNPSENFFSNANWRSQNTGGYTNALVINDTDGFDLVGGHIGFTSGAAVLVTPGSNASGAGTNSDFVAGIRILGATFDTSQSCVDFEPLASYTGSNGLHVIEGSNCELMTGDGYKFNDSSVNNVSVSGGQVLTVQNNGFNIAAGTLISLNGVKVIAANGANNGSNSILISGSASHVAINGQQLAKGSGPAMTNHINVTGTSDYIEVGKGDYSGANGADVVNTSSGTHIPAPAISTTDGAFPNVVTDTYLNSINNVRLHGASNAELDVFNNAGGLIAKIISSSTSGAASMVPTMQAGAGTIASFGAKSNTGVAGTTQIGFSGVTTIFPGGTADQSETLISTGSSSTVAAGVGRVILDGVSTYTLTTMASPLDGQLLSLECGGTATITVSANSGQSIKGSTTGCTVDQGHQWRYNTSNTTWYKDF